MRVISRQEWGAQYGRGNDVSANLPWDEAVTHTEAGAVRKQDWEELANGPVLVSNTEFQHIRSVERFHAVTRGWDGIGYSFFITFDGTVFEGRGWGRSGAHTEGRNSTAAGICFQGHGDLQSATEAQIASYRWLIGEGIRVGALKPNPRIGSHHEYSQKGKTCCGLLIRKQLHRLTGVTGPVTNTKEWDEMASKAEIEQAAYNGAKVAIDEYMEAESKAGDAHPKSPVGMLRSLHRSLIENPDRREGDPATAVQAIREGVAKLLQR